ncbi:MAG: stringent starvation protein B [Hyphomonadaceae bacterium]|nr:stringent starvation protein B [Hyphomonadaceae bacterium]
MDVSEDLIGYEALAQDALRSVVRSALQIASGPRGLPGRHHYYITFRTRAPGVVAPEHLTQRYAEEMTIVLEHQFWDLEVFQDRFRVVLRFGGEPHALVIPFSALTRFYDPSVRFGLQFETAPQAPASEPELDFEEEPPAAEAAAGGAVVSLESFRRK